MVQKITTKQVIIKVAGDLFMDKGFQATSTREIALKAGITQPNLYHHFKTKEDIYIAVLEDLSSEVQEALEILVNKEEANLVISLQNILDYLREKHPVNFSIMSHDMTYEVSRENHEYLYHIWQVSYLNPLIKLFSRYVEEGSFFTSEELARYFYAVIAPFVQTDNNFHKEISSHKIVYLFVYGVLDRNE